MKTYIYLIIALISLCAGSFGFYFMNKTKPLSMPEHALYYQQERPIVNVSLTDEDGQPFNNSQFIDKWSFIFFGYTSCPDVCPTTMQNMNFIYSDLTKIAPNSQVILVSVDPNRDSIENLKQYITYFNPNFKALRAEHDVLFPFARSLGLMYAITGKGEQGLAGNESYWVDHSASLVLINPRGNIEAIFKPEQNVGEIPAINSELLISDYKKIVALYK